MAYQLLVRKSFIKASTKLPVGCDRKLRQLLSILESNPFDKRLHSKRLRGKLEGLYSFRITREYRATFHFTGNLIELVDVADRKDIYR